MVSPVAGMKCWQLTLTSNGWYIHTCTAQYTTSTFYKHVTIHVHDLKPVMAGQDWNNISWNNFVFFVTYFSSSFSSLHCAYGLVMFTMDGDVQLPVKICYGFGLHKNIWRYHRVSLKMVQLKLQSGVLQPCLIVLTSNKCNHTLLTVSDIFFSLNFL